MLSPLTMTLRATPLALSLALFSNTPATQELVRDLETAAPPALSSNPRGFKTVGDTVYFRASTDQGEELWRLTAQGAEMIADLWPGPSSSSPARFTDLGAAGILFFAHNPDTGRELWRTDGTAAGTQLVADIHPGQPSSPDDHPTSGVAPVVLGNFAYFVADDGVLGAELWRSDGTTAGTSLAVDVLAGPDSGDIADLTVAGTQLFFTTLDALDPSLRTLWSSDGTPAGTTALATGLHSKTRVVSTGDHVFFVQTTAADGAELWVSDGTAAGTLRTFDFTTGPDSSGIALFTAIQGEAWYSVAAAGFEGLWRIDPVVLAPQLAIDLPVGSSAYFADVAEAANGVVAIYSDSIGSPGLWRTGGLSASQLPLAPQESITGQLRTAGGVVYVEGPSQSGSLIATDGATAAFVPNLSGDLAFPTLHLSANVADAADPDTAEIGGALLLAASNADQGVEPFLATPLGTVLVDNLRADEAVSDGSKISMLTRLGEELFFVAQTSTDGVAIWRSDGTEAGTQIFQPANNAIFFSLASFGGRLYYEAWGTDLGLWVSDGTAAGTSLLFAEPTAHHVTWLGELGELVFFGAYDGDEALYVTNGTQAGTVHLHTPKHTIEEGVVFQDEFWFPGYSSDTHLELFRTDGTVAGTVLGVEGVVGGSASSPRQLTVVDDLLYFFGRQNGNRTLFVTDGTQAGTHEVPGLDPDGSTSTTVSAGGALFFLRHEPTTGLEVWRADPTGAAIVIDLAPGPANGIASPLSSDSLAVVNGLLVFLGNDGTDEALYAIDPQTLAVAPIDAGQLGDQWNSPAIAPYSVLGSGEVALFAGLDELGREPWLTDGTAAGTQRLVDLWSGPVSSLGPIYAGQIVAERVGDKIFLVADDGVHGRELFVLPFADTNDWVAEPFGFGCAGSVLPAPTISASGSAQLGATLTVQAEGAEPAAAGLLLLGSGGAIDLAPGCPLWPGAAFFVGGTAIADGTGAAQRALLVPSSPATVGAAFVAQWIFADPGGALGGIASASDGLDIVVGF